MMRQLQSVPSRLLYAMFCLAIFATACAKDKKIKTEKDEAGHVVSTFEVDAKTGERDGIGKEYYQTGEVLSESHYVAGKLQGVRKIFIQDGKLDAEETYENGEYEGPYKKYFPDGKVMQTGLYKSGAMEGEWKTYFGSGQLKEIVVFSNNAENGPFVEYFENGKKKAEGHYLNGEFEEGELKMYNEAGEMTRRMNCKQGVCQTLWAADTLKQTK
ncbi:MAG: toxin-antitoxin system YwqK family antitoxin [Saprospiraceae bacterium]